MCWERGDEGRQGDKGGGTREEESGRRKQNRRRRGETDKMERGKESNREVACCVFLKKGMTTGKH